VVFEPRFPRSLNLYLGLFVAVVLSLGPMRVRAQTPGEGPYDVSTASAPSTDADSTDTEPAAVPDEPASSTEPSTETFAEAEPSAPDASSEDVAEPDAAAAEPRDDYPEDDWNSARDASATEPGRFLLESVAVEGNDRTRASVIRSYVPLQHGDLVDPEDEDIEAIRWRLLGTGWFRRVTLSLRRGEHRGWVVLVVHVRERNTVVIEQLALGASEGITRTTDTTARRAGVSGKSSFRSGALSSSLIGRLENPKSNNLLIHALPTRSTTIPLTIKLFEVPLVKTGGLGEERVPRSTRTATTH